MEPTLRNALNLAAWITILLLIVLAGIYWASNRPKLDRQTTLYIADPGTACCYPEDSARVNKLSWRDESGQPHNWDEFQSLEAAKAAGYRLCH